MSLPPDLFGSIRRTVVETAPHSITNLLVQNLRRFSINIPRGCDFFALRMYCENSLMLHGKGDIFGVLRFALQIVMKGK